jgi:hypothetical protein
MDSVAYKSISTSSFVIYCNILDVNRRITVDKNRDWI